MAVTHKPSKRVVERRKGFQRYKRDVQDRGKPFYPFAMFHDTVMSLVVVSVIVVLAVIWKYTAGEVPDDSGWLGPLYKEKADPATTSFIPRPDWYFYFLFYLLRIFKWPESVILATVGIPTICLILLLSLPFLDVRRERRLSRRPVAIVAFILTVLAMGTLTWKGAVAKEALASENEAAVPSWIAEGAITTRGRGRRQAVRKAAVPGLPYVPRRGLVEPRRARPDLDRDAEPRHRVPDRASQVPELRGARLGHAAVLRSRREEPARPRGLLRGVQGP